VDLKRSESGRQPLSSRYRLARLTGRPRRRRKGAGQPPTPSDLPRHYVEYNIPPYGRGILADHVSVDWDGNYTPDRVLYGRFWYRDIFGDEHESGFLLHIRPGGAAVAGFPKYWYWT